MVYPKSIYKDSPFQATKRRIEIGPSTSGYTLKHNPAYIPGSAIDESDWAAYDPAGGTGEVSAGDNLVVDVTPNAFYRLVGNTDESVLYQ